MLHDDISLVHLARPVTTTEAIKPICLPPGPSDDYNGTQADIAGWGHTEYGTSLDCPLFPAGRKVGATPV